MYIDPFVAGIICTILSETLVFVVAIIFSIIKNWRNK